ncbi:MAG TPA: TolC family protein [Candidatus Eremiobacteraceae bacterium]|nr:TolC family protein [Candidatus Eremiobacteraceae bacterium]
MLTGLLLAGTIAAAQIPMTLQEAVDFAGDHNASVLTARAQMEQAGAMLARDRAAGLPQVNGVAQNTMNRQSTNNAGSLAQFGLAPLPNFSQNEAELAGTQTLFNLQTALTANQARRDYDSAVENYRLVREQTLVDVHTSFYTYVQDVQLVALAQFDLQYEQTLLQIADANYKTGRVAGIDRLKAQVQVTSSEETLSSAQADAEDARENLAQLIGTGEAQQFDVPPAIPAPVQPAIDEPALNQIALVKRPEVAMAQDSLASAILANGLVDAPNRPTVTLQSGWGNLVTTTISPFQQQENIMLCGTIMCGPTHFYTISLNSQWTLPLLDWGTNHAAHGGARANIDAQSSALDAARRQALIDVDQAVRRLRVDEQNLSLATQNADVARQAAQIAVVQYRVGMASQVDVTTAEQTYLQAAKQLLDAQVGYVLGIDKLKLATGTLVD